MTADDEDRAALTTTAMDWAFGERIGGDAPPDLKERVQARLAAMPSRSGTRRSPWLLAAAALFGIGIVAAVAVLSRPDPKQQAQDPVKDTKPQPEPTQPQDPVMVSSAKEIEALPADTKALICVGIGDDAFPALLRLQRLERLEFAAAKPTGSRLVTLATLPITDAALARIAELPSLRALRLSGQTQLTNRGLAPLVQCVALKEFAVSGPALAPDALSVLKRMPRLERLELQFGTGIDKATIEDIAAADSLRQLDLWTLDPIPPDSLALLGRMAVLVELRFVGRFHFARPAGPLPPVVSDEILAGFANMRSLRRLDLGDASASKEAIQNLQQQIPGLEVLSNQWFSRAQRTVSSRAEIEALPADTTSVLGIGIEDDEARAFLRLSSLQRLELRAVMPSPMTPGKPVVPIHTLGDDGLILLTSLRSLRTLHLVNQGALTKRGYDALAAFPALGELTIDFCGAGDDDLTVFSQLPKLEALALHNFWNIHQPTIERIAAMRSLRSLDLGTNGLLETAWLKPLAGMTGLRELRLASVGFTNIDIEPPSPGLPASMRYTSAVTDELIDTFAAMRSLSSIDVSYSNLTPAGKQRLQALLPDLTVIDMTHTFRR